MNKCSNTALILGVVFVFVLIIIIGYFCYNKYNNNKNCKEDFSNPHFKLDKIKKTKKFKLMTKEEKKNCSTIKTFSDKGYKLTKLPKPLKMRLLNFIDSNTSKIRKEPPPKGYINNINKNNKDYLNYLDINLDHKLKKDLENWVCSEVEKWLNLKNLKHTSTYGIREYKEGAVLKSHVDRMGTHNYSAIINCRQRGVKEPWALDVVNFNGDEEKLYFDNNGDGIDVALYESSGLVHGREDPCKVESFMNLFIHFK